MVAVHTNKNDETISSKPHKMEWHNRGNVGDKMATNGLAKKTR